jgi:hypothetical protein
MRALERIARSLAQHQPVRREEGIGSTCKNPACKGVIFLSLNDRYDHQAIVLVNDLQSELDWTLQIQQEDAEEEGREVTEDELAEIRADYLILTESLASETPLSRKDN